MIGAFPRMRTCTLSTLAWIRVHTHTRIHARTCKLSTVWIANGNRNDARVYTPGVRTQNFDICTFRRDSAKSEVYIQIQIFEFESAKTLLEENLDSLEFIFKYEFESAQSLLLPHLFEFILNLNLNLNLNLKF